MSQVSVLLKNIWQSSKRKRIVCGKYAKSKKVQCAYVHMCIEMKSLRIGKENTLRASRWAIQVTGNVSDCCASCLNNLFPDTKCVTMINLPKFRLQSIKEFAAEDISPWPSVYQAFLQIFRVTESTVLLRHCLRREILFNNDVSKESCIEGIMQRVKRWKIFAPVTGERIAQNGRSYAEITRPK